jgi:RNA polymerase sigma factor (sigma-70 family)
MSLQLPHNTGVHPAYDRRMDTGSAAVQPRESVDEKPSWDLRAAICKAGTEGVSGLDDDALMFLLLEAVYPQDIDEIFAEIYSRYHARVNGWCRRFASNPERAEDMTQEVFFRAFRYRNSFRGEARTSTWLFTVARNYCLTSIRKANSDPSTSAALLDPGIKGESGLETHQRLERDEAFRQVWKIIQSALTPMEARVMVLHYGHGLPLDAITRHLAFVNPSGAKAYIVNAKRKLGLVLARTSRRPTGGIGRTDSASLAA